ncbi:MAG: metallophosphoesterase [Victivallales bacterium]|nr:metallophosphoesterase [Victivallales bacterium]MCF7888728.1 metallophosphoesterase [Victivallales bacterium]
MKILALSDTHYSGEPSSWTSLFDKRSVGLFNYHYLRRHRHNQRNLQKAVDYILKNPPDIVFCTGDITTSGEPSEFNFSKEKLKPLVEDNRFDFFYIPGNHDNYVKDRNCQKALDEAVIYFNKNKFSFNDMPYSFHTNELDFCLVNESYPVHMLMSHGILKKKSRKYILDWINKKTGRPKVMIGHYPLFETENLLVRWRHRLYGQKKIAEMQKKGKLDLSVCGHVHKPIPAIDERGRGEIIVGSATGNACLAEIVYNKEKDVFHYKKIKL